MMRATLIVAAIALMQQGIASATSRARGHVRTRELEGDYSVQLRQDYVYESLTGEPVQAFNFYPDDTGLISDGLSKSPWELFYPGYVSEFRQEAEQRVQSDYGISPADIAALPFRLDGYQLDGISDALLSRCFNGARVEDLTPAVGDFGFLWVFPEERIVNGVAYAPGTVLLRGAYQYYDTVMGRYHHIEYYSDEPVPFIDSGKRALINCRVRLQCGAFTLYGRAQGVANMQVGTDVPTEFRFRVGSNIQFTEEVDYNKDSVHFPGRTFRLRYP